MLFRKYDGTMIEINKCDYKNDHIYYNKIMSIKSLNIEKIKKPTESYSKKAIMKLI